MSCARWAFRPSRSTRAATARGDSTTAWCRCRSWMLGNPDPFAGLSAVLGAAPINVDPHRQRRKGVPEVVYAAGKPPRLVLAAVRALLDSQARVLVSRVPSEVVDLLRADLEPD